MARLTDPTREGGTPAGGRRRSDELLQQARRLMPGGVSSPVRAFNAVGSEPFFVTAGSGARITDVDGNSYVDLVQSWGALLFGHADPRIVSAVTAAAARGTSFGTPSELEVDLAALVVRLVPNVEKVRFVSSGTEAAMTAVRLARGATGRAKILKFEGCYHGHSDALLASAGSGMATLAIPGTPGVTPGAAGDTLLAPYNDLGAAKAAAEVASGDLAAILVEPVAANMGLVPPLPGFLEGLRDLADATGALFVLDEVITGFRVASGGAQERLDIAADLVLLGKVLGGGLPVGAVAGKAEVMDQLAPDGPIYQAGTLSGNPLAMAAGIAALSAMIEDLGLHDRLEALAKKLMDGWAAAARTAGVPFTTEALGGLAGFFFAPDPVTDSAGAHASSVQGHTRFWRGMLARGIYLPPSRFEALFLSTAHTEADIEACITAAQETLASV